MIPSSSFCGATWSLGSQTTAGIAAGWSPPDPGTDRPLRCPPCSGRDILQQGWGNPDEGRGGRADNVTTHFWSIHPGGEQKHRCSFSGNPSTSSKPAHTVQTRLKPDEMAKMKMPPPREIQELCTWAGKTGNKGEGWNLQVLRKGRKVEWEAELQPLCVNLVRFAVRTFQSFTFCFVLCFPWMTASSSSERSSFEYFGTKIDCQSEFCASPKNMCSFSRLHNWKFLEFFRRSKDVPKECFVLYTNSSTNFHFMRVKKCKILTTRIQYFIN